MCITDTVDRMQLASYTAAKLINMMTPLPPKDRSNAGEMQWQPTEKCYEIKPTQHSAYANTK